VQRGRCDLGDDPEHIANRYRASVTRSRARRSVTSLKACLGSDSPGTVWVESLMAQPLQFRNVNQAVGSL
jgi:hypothetical protein